MAFEDIECVNPAPQGAGRIPKHGVAVRVHQLGRPVRAGGGYVCYIRLSIGADLARAISLTQPQHQVRLLFGTEADAGKIRVSVDGEAGKFLAKRDKAGNYALSINAGTAEGLFSLGFPRFADERCEAIRPQNGQPPHFVFKESKDMLRVEEDEG